MNIDELTSRDLDKVVAQALGWRAEQMHGITKEFPNDSSLWVLYNPDGVQVEIALTENTLFYGDLSQGCKGVPRFSTDVSEALKLTEGKVWTCQDDTCSLWVYFDMPDGFDSDGSKRVSQCGEPMFRPFGMSDTEAFCVALCRAYLKSLEARTP